LFHGILTTTKNKILLKTSLKKSTLKAANWNLFNMFVNQARNFIISTILARLLLPEDFGLLGMAMVFASLTDSFVDFGFGNAVIQKKEVNEVQLSTVFWLNMLMALLLGVLMFLNAPIVSIYFEMPKLKPITQLMSLTFLIKGLSTLQNALYKKKLDFKTPFKINLISGFSSGALGIYLAYSNFGVYSLIYSQIFGWVLTTFFIWFFSEWKPKFIFKLKQIKELWSFGYKYSLTIFIDTIFSKLDTIVIGKLFSASVLGLFYKAQSLNRMVVQYAFSSFSGVLFPSLSQISDDKEKLKIVVVKILHIVCFSTFLFSGLMYVNAEEIIVILFTKKWLGSVPIFEIMGVFSFILTIPTVLNSPVTALGESGDILKAEIIKKTLYLFAIPFAFYYDIYYYIFATSIAAIIGMFFNGYILSKHLEFELIKQQIVIIKYLIIFLIFIAVDYFVNLNVSNNHFINIIFKSFLYFIFYVGINVVLKNKGCLDFYDIFLKKKILKLIRK
jgi:O-antigen/teichoic acid export membrane protein